MAEFSLPLRVYIEDTDAGGIVYYVNYLKYLERARTEWLRSLGVGPATFFNQALMFVVSRVALDYRQAARFDDQLTATVAVQQVRGASVQLWQRVDRGEDVLVEGEVTIACVQTATLRPRRIPADMLATLRSALHPGEEATKP